jgi:hypothetical protein
MQRCECRLRGYGVSSYVPPQHACHSAQRTRRQSAAPGMRTLRAKRVGRQPPTPRAFSHNGKKPPIMRGCHEMGCSAFAWFWWARTAAWWRCTRHSRPASVRRRGRGGVWTCGASPGQCPADQYRASAGGGAGRGAVVGHRSRCALISDRVTLSTTRRSPNAAATRPKTPRRASSSLTCAEILSRTKTMLGPSSAVYPHQARGGGCTNTTSASGHSG